MSTHTFSCRQTTGSFCRTYNRRIENIACPVCQHTETLLNAHVGRAINTFQRCAIWQNHVVQYKCFCCGHDLHNSQVAYTEPPTRILPHKTCNFLCAQICTMHYINAVTFGKNNLFCDCCLRRVTTAWLSYLWTSQLKYKSQINLQKSQ